MNERPLEKRTVSAAHLISSQVQTYAWGKKGTNSLVGRLVGASNPETPYAELWIGAHSKAPCTVLTPQGAIGLNDFISRDPLAHLGESSIKRFGPNLPFLFKVLSINPDFGLSIQAHPDSALARRLHMRDPHNYPDVNHKPEIAIPLTPLTMLYGFRTVSELRENVVRNPEIGRIAGVAAVTVLLHSPCSDSEHLRYFYTALLNATPEHIKPELTALHRRLSAMPGTDRTLTDEWFLRLYKQYGDSDIGLAALYVMNLLTIEPGLAVFTGPNVGHAYLDGDLLECMANSDNVVRAGLTPKFKDVATLISMLEYKPSACRTILPQAAKSLSGGLSFKTPAEEFQVEFLSQKNGNYSVTSDGCASLLFCLEGSCRSYYSDGSEGPKIEAGQALFVPSAAPIAQLELNQGTVYRITVSLL